MQDLRIVDLGEAAVLMTFGFSLTKLEQSRRANRKVFVFAPTCAQDESLTASQLLERYHTKDVQVDAYTLILNYKELKSRIHNVNESQE